MSFEPLQTKSKINKFQIIAISVISLVAGMLIANYFEINLLDLLGLSKKVDNVQVSEQSSNDSNLTKDQRAALIESQIEATIKTNLAETPTVANIKNISVLKQKNPLFYKDAIEGDFLIIYSDKAIIYRESENKIIAMIPLSEDSSL